MRCKRKETGIKVDTLDCQSLIVHSSLIERHDLRFDENLQFDLYVEDFCINAKIKHNIESSILKLSCCHWSQLSNIKNRPSYKTMLKHMNDKYNDRMFSGTCSFIGNTKGIKYKTIGYSTIYDSYSTENKFDIDDTGLIVLNVDYDEDKHVAALRPNTSEDVRNVDLDNFIVEDFESYNKKFDYIVFENIIDRIRNPQDILEKFKVFLKKDGAFLASFSNVSHASIKMNLLVDNWTYTEIGVLDKKHIKFFTYKSIAQFLAEIDLKIADMNYALADRKEFQPNSPWRELPSLALRTIYKNPHSFVTHYNLKIVPDTENMHYGKLLDINMKKLSITASNATPLLKHYMFMRSGFGILKKLLKIK